MTSHRQHYYVTKTRPPASRGRKKSETISTWKCSSSKRGGGLPAGKRREEQTSRVVERQVWRHNCEVAAGLCWVRLICYIVWRDRFVAVVFNTFCFIRLFNDTFLCLVVISVFLKISCKLLQIDTRITFMFIKLFICKISNFCL